MATIDFYFDVVSPYSWFAFEQLLDAAHQSFYKARLIPFFLGGVMQATGNVPPATLPARGVYLMTDIQRTAEFYGMKVQTPSNFPINSIRAQRLLVAVQRSHPQELVAVARGLWRAYWGGEDQNIADLKVLAAIVTKVTRLTAVQVTDLIKSSDSAAIKDALKQNTGTQVGDVRHTHAHTHTHTHSHDD